jgi:ribosomal protein S12
MVCADACWGEPILHPPWACAPIQPSPSIHASATDTAVPRAHPTGKGKPAGMNAGRKLLDKRRDERWADKKWKKEALGTTYKVTPFQGASHAKGIALEKVGVESKQPNSAIRKCIRVQLIKNGKKVTAFVPMDGCLNFIEENVRAPT